MIEKEIKAWVLKLDCPKDNPDDGHSLFCGECDDTGDAIFSSKKTPIYFTTEKVAQDYLKTAIIKEERKNIDVYSVMLRKHKPFTNAEANFLSCVILLDQHSIPHDFTTQADELKERNYQWFSDLVSQRALK